MMTVFSPLTGDPMTAIWIVMAISASLMLISGAVKLFFNWKEQKKNPRK